MNLERMAAVIRPRSPWEAIDLGFGMVRAWWRAVAASWFATAIPLWLILVLIFHRSPGWAMAVFWWLKPLLDRVPLFVLSRALFGATPSAGETARATPRLWAGHLLQALTFYRFDLARSFNLPVWELEGLRGTERWNRATVLQQGTHGAAVWLTIACALLQAGTFFALLGFVALLIPEVGMETLLGLDAQEGAAAAGPTWQAYVLTLTNFVALSLIEPFYVAAGFSLYLSRRTQLEGWDVEIAFRRLAHRLRSDERPQPARVLRAGLFFTVFLLWAAGSAFLAAPAQAKTQTQTQDPAIQQAGSSAQKTIREVLADKDFETTKRLPRWRFKGDLPDFDFNRGDGGGDGPSFSIPFVRTLAYIVALVIAVGLILALARWGLRNFSWAGGRPNLDSRPVPTTLFGLDLRPESLPGDVPGTAWSLWEQGDPAAALSLLYRGALSVLVRRDGAPVRASWTEGDCLSFVAGKSGKERTGYFTTLTRAWQSTAYAHRPPGRDVAESLCKSWLRHFGERREAA